jgi:hypothetical protein
MKRLRIAMFCQLRPGSSIEKHRNQVTPFQVLSGAGSSYRRRFIWSPLVTVCHPKAVNDARPPHVVTLSTERIPVHFQRR